MDKSDAWRAVIHIEDALNAFIKQSSVSLVGTVTFCVACGASLPCFNSPDHKEGCICLDLWQVEQKARQLANEIGS